MADRRFKLTPLGLGGLLLGYLDRHWWPRNTRARIRSSHNLSASFIYTFAKITSNVTAIFIVLFLRIRSFGLTRVKKLSSPFVSRIEIPLVQFDNKRTYNIVARKCYQHG